MGCLGSFVSVGGPEGRNVMVEKEKGIVGDRVAAGPGLSADQSTLLNMASSSSRSTNLLPLLLFEGHTSSPTSSRRRVAAAWVVELERAVFHGLSAGFGCGRVLERSLSLSAFVSPSFSPIE